MSEKEMVELGVYNSSHRATIMTSLYVLKDKFETARKRESAGLRVPTIMTNANTPSPQSNNNRLSLSISPSEKMRSDLDSELRGDPGELRSHGWYHGNIPRVRAESLVKNPSDFLVRDCTSKPGDFVLTSCGHDRQPVHFMINSRVLDAEPGCLPKILYQFEERTFSSVQLLIQYHLSSQMPVTKESGLRINWPITRRMPLSYYDTKFGVTRSPSGSPSDSPRSTRHQVQRSASHQMLGDDNRELSKSPSPLSDKFGSMPMINKTIHQPVNNNEKVVVTPPIVSHHRSGSEPMLTPTNDNESFNYLTLPQNKLTPAISDTKLNSQPPPKPSRIPSVKYRQRPIVQVRKREPVAEDDRDYSDYATIKSEPSWLEGSRPTSRIAATHAAVPTQKSAPLATMDDDVKKGSPLSPPVNAHVSPVSKPKIDSTEKPKRVLGRRALSKAKLATPTTQNSTVAASSILSKPNTNVNVVSNKTDMSSTSSALQNIINKAAAIVPVSASSRPDSFNKSNKTAAMDIPSGTNANVNLNDSRNVYANTKTSNVNVYAKAKPNTNVNLNTNTKPIKPTINLPLPANGNNNITSNTSITKTNQTTSNPNDESFNDAIDHSSNYTFSFSFMKSRKISVPSLAAVDPSSYESPILPSDNKPLDPSVIVTIKSLLLETPAKVLATHLTAIDLDLLRIAGEHDLGMGVQSGLEMVTLPQGSKLRDQLIERVNCIRLFVTTTILTATNTTERTRVLHQWIQIATELRGTRGNLMGFVAVMDGIVAPQVTRLRDTWLVLRQIHTGSAYFYDTKLRAYYRAQNNGSAALPLQDVTIPNIIPLVSLLQRGQGSVMDIAPWEGSDPSSSLDILLTHLDTARLICSQSGLYRITSENIMKNFQPDRRVTDLFHTEFHMRQMVKVT